MSLPSWQIFFNEGVSYRMTLQKARSRPLIFTPVIMHNLSAMAIEKLFMALLVFDKRMPDNHTLMDLVQAVEKKFTVNEELAKNLEYMDSLQQICTMEKYVSVPIVENDISCFIDCCDRVFAMVTAILPNAEQSVV